MKSKTYFFLLLLIIFILHTNIILAKESGIKVNVKVEPRQELIVKDDIDIIFDYPWDGMDSGKPFLVENIGRIIVKSNVDWTLQINTKDNFHNLEVYIKPKNSGRWRRVDQIGTLITGLYGLKNISWDLKVLQSDLKEHEIKLNKDYSGGLDEKQIELMFTLTQS